MNTKHKILMILFILMMVCVFVGCDKNDSVTGSEDDKPNYGSITITGDLEGTYEFDTADVEKHFQTNYYGEYISVTRIQLYKSLGDNIYVEIYFDGSSPGIYSYSPDYDTEIRVEKGEVSYSSLRGDGSCEIKVTKYNTTDIIGTFGGCLEGYEETVIFVEGDFILPRLINKR